MRRSLMALAAGAAFVLPAFATSAFAAEAPSKEAAQAEVKKTDADVAKAKVEESARPVQRSIPFRGGTLAYTVTPGTLTIRNDEGAPTASIFYVAYTVKQAPGAAPRPVTFLYNGGPGSSSMWLHLGSFAPVKVAMPTAEGLPAAPYHLSANPDTLLDKTDLVFIDAPETGLSRAIGKAEPKAFYGVDADLDAFTRAIQRYLTVYGRWNSPKFLIGESYGTLRSAGLALSLQEHGVQLNGVTLVSTVLNIGNLFQPNDQGFVNIMPTYAATAWYHNRLQNKPADLAAYLAEVRSFAAGPYTLALAKGTTISSAERDQVARQLAAYIGVTPEFVLNNDLRIDPDRFRAELLRGQRRIVGRLDSRFVGENADAGAAETEYDPTDAAMTGAWVGALNDYLFRDLGYQTDLTYRPNNYGGMHGPGGGWDWRHKVRGGGQLSADTSVDLATAMRHDPHLKLLEVAGWYDMATPFFGAEYDINHMALEPDRKANVSFKYYPSGHMVYIEPGSAHQLKADVDAFIDSAK